MLVEECILGFGALLDFGHEELALALVNDQPQLIADSS